MRRLMVVMLVSLAPWLTPGLASRAGADPLPDDDCVVTGNGAADYGVLAIDAFAVSVNRIHGTVSGTFSFTTSTGTFVGSVDAVSCGRDGGGGPGVPNFNANIADIEGTGTFNGVPGYAFGANLQDHGEGKSSNQLPDELAAAVADGGGTVVSRGAGLLTSGNIQLRAIHP